MSITTAAITKTAAWIAGPSERRAAEDDEARAGGAGRDADAVPGPEHHHPAGLERLARDRDRAFDDVEAAILVIVGEQESADPDVPG